MRKLEDDYQRFVHIYQGIIIRLDKLESLLSDAERVLDLTRISVRRIVIDTRTRAIDRFPSLLAASARRTSQRSNPTGRNPQSRPGARVEK